MSTLYPHLRCPANIAAQFLNAYADGAHRGSVHAHDSEHCGADDAYDEYRHRPEHRAHGGDAHHAHARARARARVPGEYGYGDAHVVR